MNYTEEHYADMYNNLPEGLKDLVLSGRLAIQVSAIGSRHGLNADQVADLEPAVEDICLGLILKNQLGENIKTQVGVDDRVANRIAAEVEIEILRPFEPELIIARHQKEDLDKKIAGGKQASKPAPDTTAPVSSPAKAVAQEFEPKDLSEKSNVTAIKNFYGSPNSTPAPKENQPQQSGDSFDWESFGKETEKKEVPTQPEASASLGGMSVDEKIDKLTDTINSLVQNRFGGEKKDEGVSLQMQELIKRLEVAEQQNLEHKKIIEKMQSGNQLSSIEKSVPIDKPRSVSIDKTQTPQTVGVGVSGNVKIEATTQNSLPVLPVEKIQEPNLNQNLTSKKDVNLYSSVVSQATADTIVETRNKENSSTPITTSTKAALSLDELLAKNDPKINTKPTTAEIVFPTINTDKQIDIKNVAQTEGLRATLLEDVEFLKRKLKVEEPEKIDPSPAVAAKADVGAEVKTDDFQNLSSAQPSVTLSQFKDELVPKTQADRMKALQQKISAMNTGVSVGGTTNIAASSLDPYKL